MCGGSHPWLSFVLTLMLATTASIASAQPWLADRKLAEGSGLRIGDLELHPGLSAEGGYTNNVYFAEDDELGSAVLRIAPHLFLSTLGEERSGGEEATPGMLKFKGGLSANLQHYFAEAAPSTDFGANADLSLTIAPDRPVSLTLSENFNRSFKPFNDPIGDPEELEGVESPDYARYSEVAGARLLFQTGGGLLQAGLGYRFGYSWYEDDSFADNDNLTHTVLLNAAWEFLPKTAIFYDASFTHQNYTENDEPPSNPSSPPLFDGNQLTSRIGLNGAITSRIAATIAAGYAVGFFDGGDEFEGLTLNAEARYTPSEISELGLGFERAYTSAYQGNFVLRNQGYARLRFFFGGAFVLATKLAVEFLEFGVDPIQGPREDTRYSADVSGEYRFIDWLALTAQLSALIDDTDFVSRIELPVEDGDPLVFEDPAKFTQFEAWLGLRAFF
jgi:hypothetical protein